MRVAGIGQIYMWEGGSLLIGHSAGATDVHAHHAFQVAIAGDPSTPLRFRTADEWAEYPVAIIPSHRRHAFDGGGATVAHIFVEPETPEGRAIAERYRDDEGIVRLPRQRLAPSVERLFAAWEEARGAEHLIPAARAVVRELTGGVEPRTAVDERVLRAIAYLRQNLHRPITLDEVAASVFLSPSRFRHLFVQETGMALRPYLLWLRFMRVLEDAAAGETLTAAAHRAGFADSAHLTRTSHRMFGIAPTALRFEG
jgi:AraC family transcriptional regulator